MDTKIPSRRVPSYRLYRERSGESDDFWLHCETIPERTHLHNWEIAAHRHDGFFQIFVLTAGLGDLLGGASPLPLAAPCAIFVPPGQVHGFRFSRDIDGLVVTALADRLATVAASDRRIAAYASDVCITPLDADDPAAVSVVSAVQGIHDEVRSPGVGSTVLLDALMIQAIIGLTRLGEIATNDRRGNREGARLERLDTLISAHFREGRPVGFYAERIGVSPAHLNRIARAGTGESVQGLVARRIMEVARRDLIFTPTPVGAIADALGFADPAYFNRFFKRRTGSTPGAFRARERARLAG